MNSLSSILAWVVVLGLVQMVLAAMAAVGQRGLPWAASARDENNGPLSGVGGRLQRAQANFLETFPLFAALLLAVMVRNPGDGHALLGAQLYFWSRVAYVPVYAAGIPWLRTLIWLVSVIGIVLLLVAVF